MSQTLTLDALSSSRPTPRLPSWHPMGHMVAMHADPLGTLERARAVGDTVWLRMAHLDTLFVFHPSAVQHVLVDRADNYVKQTRGYALLRVMLGEGLLTSEGEFWKQQRRVAQPAFHRRAIARFAETMAHAATELCEAWSGTEDPVDVAEAMNRLTLRIACATLFSCELGPRADTVGRALETLLHAFDWMVTSPLPSPHKWPIPISRRFHAAIADLDTVVRELIAERRASGAEIADLMGMFIAAGMTDDQLRDELLTMLLAGHETTANALSWALALLSDHPEVARAVAAEVDGVCGDREPGLSDLPQLALVDRVVHEALRLYPPAWIVARTALEDDVIDGQRVPKGTFVFLGTWAIHRHPDLWSEPDVFDPDRWLPERAARRPKLAFLPFSAGARKCIGEQFALMEARLILAVIARRYRLSLVPGHRIGTDASVTLRPKGGLPMHVRPYGA